MDLRERVYGHGEGERKRVAKAAGITPTYLYMLCTGRRRVDSVALAQRLESACEGRVAWTEFLGVHGSTPAEPAA